MQITAIGDKSRYQFFRNMVEYENQIEGDFFTEKLGDNDVYLTSQKTELLENMYYSKKIPLNTTIFFPNEYDDLVLKSGTIDKILVFDEFPYVSDSEIKNLHKVLVSNILSQIEVVLVKNGRESLNSDISTEETAISEAKKYYGEMGIDTCIYDTNSSPKFLLYTCYDFQSQGKKLIQSYIRKVQKELDIFDSVYEFSVEISEIPLLIEVDILARFFDYNDSIRTKNIWKVYRRRAFDFYWKSNKRKIVKIYSEVYKNMIGEICIWNIQKDIDELTNVLQQEFRQALNVFSPLSFYGEKEYYDDFLNEHKEEVIKFKIIIKDFFNIKLREILKKRIQHKINKMEELIR